MFFKAPEENNSGITSLSPWPLNPARQIKPEHLCPLYFSHGKWEIRVPKPFRALNPDNTKTSLQKYNYSGLCLSPLLHQYTLVREQGLKWNKIVFLIQLYQSRAWRFSSAPFAFLPLLLHQPRQATFGSWNHHFTQGAPWLAPPGKKGNANGKGDASVGTCSIRLKNISFSRNRWEK